MPGAINYIPPTDLQRSTFSAEALLERQKRETDYRRAVAYYLGEQPDQLEEIDPLSDVEEPDDNIVVNMVRITADRTATFLFPEIPKIDLDPESVEETEEEKWVRLALEDNGGLKFFTKWALRGFLSGHTFIRVRPSTKKKGYPRITLLDPLMVTVYWRVDDVADVLWYEIRYNVGADHYITDIVNMPDSGVNGQWHIYTYKRSNPQNDITLGMPTPHGSDNALFDSNVNFDFNNFKAVGSVEVWPSPICPVQETPHLPHPDSYYGLSEAGQSMTDLQDAINRMWSMLNRISRLNSDPKDVITGADVDDVEDGGNILTIPNAQAKVQRLEMRSDLGASGETVDKLIETYLAISRVVLLKGEAKDLQRVTNASVRTLFLDALSKNSILQSAYGSTVKMIVQLLLQMSKFDLKFRDNAEAIKVKFGSPLPTDATEIANVAAIYVNMGAMSLRTAATDAGKDWAFEQQAMTAEHTVAMEQQRERLELEKEFAPPPSAAIPK